MSDNSKIEWTRSDDGTAGATWNPVTGCERTSAGCDHCYALTFAERWRGVPGHYFEHGFDVQCTDGRRRKRNVEYFDRRTRPAVPFAHVHALIRKK